MKSHIILINYNGPSTELFSFMPDNGLASLSSFALSEGYEPLVLDYITTETGKRLFNMKMKETIKEVYRLNENLQEQDRIKKMNEFKKLFHKLIEEEEDRIGKEIISAIKKFNSTIVGFKLWEGMAFHGSIRIAEKIKKEYPRIITLGGGPHVDMYDSHILEFTRNFDFLIYGEGEIPLIELIKYTQGKGNLKSIPNLIYRDGSEIIKNPPRFISNLEELPSPLYDEEIYPAMKEGKKINVFLLEESRGCPNRCKFCIHPRKSGSSWRNKKPSIVVDEMEKIINKYSSSTFRLTGSNPPPGLLTSISKEIIKRKLTVNFSTFGHTRAFPEENYPLMRKAGCRAMAFGIESGSQYILDESIGKGISVKQSKDALKASKEAGIYTIASVIVPAPFETKETMDETFNLLLEANPDSVTVQFAILNPNTIWWEDAEKYNFQFKDREKLLKKLMKRIPPSLLPPPLWERIHYKLNDMNDREILKISQGFIERLRKHGIEHGTSDFVAILALGAGWIVRELKEKSDLALWKGDFDTITEIVNSINKD